MNNKEREDMFFEENVNKENADMHIKEGFQILDNDFNNNVESEEKSYITNFVPRVTPEESMMMKKILMSLNNIEENILKSSDEKEFSTFESSKFSKIENKNKNLVEEKDQMKKLIDKIYDSAEKITENLVEKSKESEYYRDLISSKRDSIILNNRYEIRVRLSETLGTKKNFYDIYDVENNKFLCKDLFLFEAAEAIVRLLNAGEDIFGERIRNVIFYEQKYVKNRQDAAIYKKRINDLVKKGKTRELKIYEAKYNNSKEQALRAKKKIIEIINNI